ncbi:MAG TPA: AIR synthase-related protein, partial [Methyloradius sp.]
TAEIKKTSWQLPALFGWLQAQGNVTDDEMYRTFNCGIGMVVIVSAEYAAQAQALLSAEGEQVFAIGRIRRSGAGEHATVVV